MTPGSAAGGWVHLRGCMLPQNHQLVLDRRVHRRLVGRFCPRFHYTQSVVFPLEFIHGDPLLLWMHAPETRLQLHLQSSCQSRKFTRPRAGGVQYVCHDEGKSHIPLLELLDPLHAWLEVGEFVA